MSILGALMQNMTLPLAGTGRFAFTAQIFILRKQLETYLSYDRSNVTCVYLLRTKSVKH